MESHQKTLIICEVFSPEDFLINDLAKQWELEEKDFEVLTRVPSYPYGKVYNGYKNRNQKTKIQSITIHRVPILQGYQKNKVIKILNYFVFVFWSTLKILLIGRRFNNIFIYQTGPLTLAIAGIIHKKISKSNVTIWIQDLWPETVYAYGIKKTKFLSFCLDKFVKWIYNNCDKILVSCNGFSDKIHKYVPDKPIIFTPNWSLLKYEPTKEIKLPGSFNFTFAGNVGKVQNLDNVVRGFALFVKDFPNVYLNIVGDGSYLNDLRKIVKSEEIINVNFTGRKPICEMSDIYNSSDVLIVSLIDDPLYQIMIPSKFQAYLATAKPIYSIFNGEVSYLVNKYKIGLSANPTNIQEIALGFKKFISLSKEEIKNISLQSSSLLNSTFQREKVIENINKNVFKSDKKNCMSNVKVINGGEFTDNRGQIHYVNDFDFEGVKRFYTIEHSDISIIRAWQGHQHERKWFYVTKGTFCVAWVKINNWEHPSKNLTPKYILLNETESKIVHIPQGYANGLKALEPGSKIVIFSDMDVKESIDKEIRFDKHLWLNWNSIK